MSIKVSVIIPVYNVQKYLPRTIRSVLDQTINSFELILVDDGSTDESDSICDLYADLDERIHVIHMKNGGVSSARNIALDYCTTDYVTFIDSDDYVEPNYLRDLISNKCDIVIAGYVLENVNGEVLKHQVYQDSTICIADSKRILDLYKKGLFNYSCGKLFKNTAEAINMVRFSEEINLGEDTEFNIKYLAKAKTVGVISSTQYHYIKYPQPTLANLPLSKEMIKKNELSDNAAFDAIKVIVGRQNGISATAYRSMLNYKNIIEQLIAGRYPFNIFQELMCAEWYKRGLAFVDELFPEDSIKFRLLLKTGSPELLYLYSRFR